MTDEQADAAMQAAVNSENVSDSDANVNNWAGAANAMRSYNRTKRQLCIRRR